MTDWPAAEARLRGDMLAAGCAPAPVARVVADLAPAFAAIERARGDVPDDLLRGLAAVAAHRRKVHGSHL
jgi:hypothetical protein